ncbi:MAG TPA: hypothetical protein VNA89_04240 [Gemmatimonadaceae bacterium]|nr:hypothetical protein [Gemmatimonadaceae bacterium]
MPRAPSPRHRLTTVAAVATLAACGGGDGGPGPSDPCAPAATAATAATAAFDLAAPLPNAAAGSGSFTITGAIPLSATARATAFEAGASQTGIVFASLSVLDAAGRPTGELFFFLDRKATPGTIALVPITLADIKSAGAPPGSFAVYADHYDATVQDYTRWLLSTGGCVRLSAATSGAVGRIAGDVHLTGQWQTRAGAPLGAGGGDATFDAPLLRVLAPTTAPSLADSIEITTSGARADADGSRQLVAFQALGPQTARWVAVGSVPAFAGDSLGELWLSLNRLPRSGETVTLADPTIDAALAAGAPTDYAMLRVIELTGIPTTRAVRQLWRSTGGSVTFTDVVQNGPLGVCGYAVGRYDFPADGTELAAGGGRTPRGSARVTGAFAARFTVLLPHLAVTPAPTGPSPLSVATDDLCP